MPREYLGIRGDATLRPWTKWGEAYEAPARLAGCWKLNAPRLTRWSSFVSWPVPLELLVWVLLIDALRAWKIVDQTGKWDDFSYSGTESGAFGALYSAPTAAETAIGLGGRIHIKPGVRPAPTILNSGEHGTWAGLFRLVGRQSATERMICARAQIIR